MTDMVQNWAYQLEQSTYFYKLFIKSDLALSILANISLA